MKVQKKSYLTSCCIRNNILEGKITNSIPERWEKYPLKIRLLKRYWKNWVSSDSNDLKKFLIYRKYKLPQSCMYSSCVKTMWIKTRTFVFRHVISAGVPPCRLAVRRLKVHKPETVFFFIHFLLSITKSHPKLYLVFKELKFVCRLFEKKIGSKRPVNFSHRFGLFKSPKKPVKFFPEFLP